MNTVDLETQWLSEKKELLQALHLLTREGKLNQDARRKLKQIQHLAQLLKPLFETMIKNEDEPHLLDVGSGKSYLGFLLNDLYFEKQRKGWVTNLESRAELIKNGQELAQKLKIKNMDFVVGQIENFTPKKSPHLLTALHACDTATDDAILLGLKLKVNHLAIVPCCQAEVARLLKNTKLEGEFKKIEYLYKHPIHTREFGSHLTNVLRCMVLEAHGYQVTVTELTGWEHSMKNELIIAVKKGEPLPEKQKQLEEFLKVLPVKPKLVREC